MKKENNNNNIPWKNTYKTLGNENPKKIADDICSALSEITNGDVYVKIDKIDQSISSMYTSKSIADTMNYFTKQIKTTPSDRLGVQDDKTLETYSVSIKSPKYPDYNYRMMFIEFNFTFYPVKVVLDEEISSEIGCEEVIIARNEEEFRSVFDRTVGTEKVSSIIEGLITAIEISKK